MMRACWKPLSIGRLSALAIGLTDEACVVFPDDKGFIATTP